MAGRKPSSAVKDFVDPIQEALGCFADGRVSADKYRAGHGILAFNGGEPTVLNGPARVQVSVIMRYRLEQAPEGWLIHTTSWAYSLFDANEHPLLEYHWHPVSRSTEVRPHVHLPVPDRKLHYPTGRIMIEDVLHCAIQYGAEPRDAKTWKKTEEKNRKDFVLRASWGAVPGTKPPPAP